MVLSTIKKRLFKKWTATRLGSRMLLFCLPVYFLHEVQWIHFHYSIHCSCYHQGWVFWVEHYFCYCLVWRTENIHEQKKVWVGLSTAGFPPAMILRVVQFGCTIPLWTTKGLTSKGAVTRIYKNANSRNCHQFEWNIEIISQTFKEGMNITANKKSRHRGTNLKKNLNKTAGLKLWVLKVC